MENVQDRSTILAIEDQWRRQADKATAARSDRTLVALLSTSKIDNLDIPTLPASTAVLIEMCQDVNTDYDQLAEIIQTDPGLSVHMLQLANSAYYGQSKSVDSIPRAITVLGLKQVGTICLSCKLVEVAKEASVRSFDFAAYWERSLAKAVLAKEIAREMGSQLLDESFLAGLLQDIGSVILWSNRESECQEIIRQSEQTPDHPRWRLERKAFGLDYARLGAALSALWKFPDSLTEAIRLHLRPVKQLHLTDRISVLHGAAHAAHVLSDVLLGQRPSGALAKLSETKLLPPQALLPVLSRSREALAVLSGLFEKHIPRTAVMANLINEAADKLERISQDRGSKKDVA